MSPWPRLHQEADRSPFLNHPFPKIKYFEKKPHLLTHYELKNLLRHSSNKTFLRKSSSQRWRGEQFNERQINGLFGVVNFSVHDVSKESDIVFKRLWKVMYMRKNGKNRPKSSTSFAIAL